MSALHPDAATRYAAQDEPGKWHEASWQQAGYGNKPAGTARLAHYRERRRIGKGEGDISIEVRSTPDVADGRPVVDGYCERAGPGRPQLNFVKRYNTWDEAMKAARDYLRVARAFTSPGRDPLRDRLIETRRAYEWARAYCQPTKTAEKRAESARRAFERAALRGSK